jgi:hypothetical protein
MKTLALAGAVALAFGMFAAAPSKAAVVGAATATVAAADAYGQSSIDQVATKKPARKKAPAKKVKRP